MPDMPPGVLLPIFICLHCDIVFGDHMGLYRVLYELNVSLIPLFRMFRRASGTQNKTRSANGIQRSEASSLSFPS